MHWSSNIWFVGIVTTVIGAIVGVLIWKGHWTETGRSAKSLTPRFVQFFSPCGVHRQKDGKWLGQLQTQWDVTNFSQSGMPARLLTARLAKPRLPDARPAFEEARGNVIIRNSATEVIAANTTERITIHFSVLLPPSKLRSLTLHIVVIDQLSNKHVLPRITVKPQMLQPAN